MSFFRFPLAPPMYITPLVYHPKIVSGHLECAPSQSRVGAKLFSIFSTHLTFLCTGGFVSFFRTPLAPPVYIAPLVYHPKIVSGHLECAPSQYRVGAKLFIIFSRHLTFLCTSGFVSFFRTLLAPPMYIPSLVYHPKIVSGHLECALNQSRVGAKVFSIFSMHLTFLCTGGFVLFFRTRPALPMYITALVYYRKIVSGHLECAPSQSRAGAKPFSIFSMHLTFPC